MRLGVARFSPKPEDGIKQDPLDQHEHEQSPPDGGVQEIVGDPGEVTAREQGRLRVLLRATSREREQAERGDPPERVPASGPEEHYAFILW
jgi:hypothetical protein